MIFEAMELLRSELKAYIRSFSSTASVELGSIASVAGSQSDKVLLSLVNVEEEAALKNIPPYKRNQTGGFDTQNPPVFLNLYVLICANFTDDTTYETALKLLSRTVQCFQRKNTFTLANTPAATTVADFEAASLRLTLELYGLTFEKMNQLWGTLGGKQVPFVLYKARVVEEQAEGVTGSGPPIRAIEGRGEVILPVVKPASDHGN